MDDFRPINRDVWRGECVAVQVLSRSCVRKGACAHREPYVLISISQPGVPHPEPAHGAGHRDTLRVAFHDRLEGGISEPQAIEIAEFVKRHYAKGIRLFVVHCDAGMSRSAAVAAAIWSYFEGDPETFFTEYHPNTDTFAKVSEALRLPQRT
jgi:predicted protein tyrosine phosphatase